jgi:hypothetical protein
MSQTPIDSGFGPANTASDVIKCINLTGKVAIVTGGYVGLGLETTQALLSAGATVIVGVRTPEKAAANLSGLSVETIPLDLTDPSSIDSFASTFLASSRPLHLLINNAAVMASPLLRDSRGYELQFATNHLGHFQLTARLWPALVKANGARVICVSSRGQTLDAERALDRCHVFHLNNLAVVVCIFVYWRKCAGVMSMMHRPRSNIVSERNQANLNVGKY